LEKEGDHLLHDVVALDCDLGAPLLGEGYEDGLSVPTAGVLLETYGGLEVEELDLGMGNLGGTDGFRLMNTLGRISTPPRGRGRV